MGHYNMHYGNLCATGSAGVAVRSSYGCPTVRTMTLHRTLGYGAAGGGGEGEIRSRKVDLAVRFSSEFIIQMSLIDPIKLN